MGYFAPSLCSFPSPICIHGQKLLKTFHYPLWKHSYQTYRCQKSEPFKLLVFCCINESDGSGNARKPTEVQKYKWVRTSSNLSEEEKQAISQLPSKMTNRCKALMKQIICYSPENRSVSLMLAAWVKSTKPRRADWLSVLKELDRLSHPLYFEVGGLLPLNPLL
ncbi:hypothetical protein CDL12_23778 [Handroanthus impetiginosus]|uniref:Uncharacterized protein n=1 Tax=Handroanthus impetiginosus TaxID=429701 RepID=A0A2G9GEI7_9LAMI|nr:hypothetical protein CDL12_23778 [Handroanthus impetiginosus]